MKLISTTIINAPISKTPKGKKTSIIQSKMAAGLKEAFLKRGTYVGKRENKYHSQIKMNCLKLLKPVCQ